MLRSCIVELFSRTSQKRGRKGERESWRKHVTQVFETKKDEGSWGIDPSSPLKMLSFRVCTRLSSRTKSIIPSRIGHSRFWGGGGLRPTSYPQTKIGKCSSFSLAREPGGGGRGSQTLIKCFPRRICWFRRSFDLASFLVNDSPSSEPFQGLEKPFSKLHLSRQSRARPS